MNRKQQIPDIVKNDILFQTKNIETMSDDEIVTILLDIIDREIENEITNEILVKKCLGLLEELMPIGVKMTEEELTDNIRVLQSKQSTVGKTKTTHCRYNIWKVLPIVATLVLILCLSLNVVAIQHGYKNAWEYVSQKVSYFFDLNVGDTINEGQIAFTKKGEGKVYNNLAELLEQENLNILYPTVLPEKVCVTELNIITGENSTESICFVFNDKQYTLLINNHYSINLDMLSTYSVYEYRGNIYYLLDRQQFCQAICRYEEQEYVITAPDMQNLLVIINNFKEIN